MAEGMMESFIELEVTPSLLRKLKLPPEYDNSHHYKYRIYRHIDGEAFFFVDAILIILKVLLT